jgi:hypothetical protein
MASFGASAAAGGGSGRRLLRTALKWGGGALVVGTVGSAAFVRLEFGPDALPRLVEAYSYGIPCLIDYKRVQWLHDRIPRALGRPVDRSRLDAEYDALHAKWAPRLLAGCFSMGGFYLKGGQLVATNYANTFPRQWSEAFAPVLDAQPHKPWEQVEAIVKSELGLADLGEVFASFDKEPMAAASIGQVHRAVLRGSGRRVVVKVQYPEVEGRFRGDVRVTKWFYHVAMPEQEGQLDEVERQFANEFDYVREAAQLALVRDNLAKTGGTFRHVLVPEPLPHLCTKRVLTMEEVVGAVKLTSALEDDARHAAADRGITLKQLLAEEDAANVAALAAGRLRCGPDAATMGRYITSLRWRNAWRRLVGQPALHVPLNHAALVDELMAVHGHQWLVDGAASGDPHAGNLLVVRGPDGDLAPDSRGRYLALVDFGQLKVLTDPQRLAAARLVVALGRADPASPADRAAVAALSTAVGLHTAHDNPDVLFDLTVRGREADRWPVCAWGVGRVRARCIAAHVTHLRPLAHPPPTHTPRPTRRSCASTRTTSCSRAAATGSSSWRRSPGGTRSRRCRTTLCCWRARRSCCVAWATC